MKIRFCEHIAPDHREGIFEEIEEYWGIRPEELRDSVYVLDLMNVKPGREQYLIDFCEMK